MMFSFHILINSADTDEMPLFVSSLFAKVPVCYYCLPVPRQLKFTKVIQACVYYCILHIKCLNRAGNDRTNDGSAGDRAQIQEPPA